MSEFDKNAVLDALLRGEFLEAVAAFESLETRLPLERVFAGAALLALSQSLRALEQFIEAKNGGLEDAAPLVATVYRLAGSFDQAQLSLNEVRVEKLNAFGQALYEREIGLLELRNGRARVACQHLERAFRIGLSDPAAKVFQADFAKSLCHVYSAIGNDAKLLEVIEFALPRASVGVHVRLLLDRAIGLTNTGRFMEAEQQFDELATANNPSALALISYYRAHLERVRGLNVSAAEGFTRAALQARESGQAEVEAFAELGLSRIATMLDDEPLARAHLSRARARAEGVQLHAELAFAQGALLARLRDAKGVEILEAALEGFDQLGLERDAGLVQLHLAEAYLRRGEAIRARVHLECAVDARHACGSGSLFAAELRALPAVFDLLATALGQTVVEIRSDRARQKFDAYTRVLLEDWRTLETQAPAQVTLTTLGGVDLRVDGVRPRLESGLSRTVTMVAFLADRGRAGVNELIGAVFEEDSPASARRYIQSIRSSLKRTLPTLSIPFDEHTRTYSLRPVGVRLAWDVTSLREAVSLGNEAGLRAALGLYTGAFLPQAESDWAFGLRHELQNAVSRLGLSVLEKLRTQGELDKCIDLSERLLEINPLDVPVVMLLIDALTEVRGVTQARQRLGAARARFMHEIGDVPEDVLALESSPQLLSN